jgi:hypothetical protein
MEDDQNPKDIRREKFPQIPNNLDAACIWSSNNAPYFFKGKAYWRLNENLELLKGYPKTISDHWPTIPNSIGACFRAPNNKTYFFKNDKYWLFHDFTSEFEVFFFCLFSMVSLSYFF